MKKIWMLFCALALTIASSAYCDTISGTIIPPTMGIVIDLRDPFGYVVDSTLVMDPHGKYSLSTFAFGDFTVTPALPGYKFSPPSRSIRLIGKDYTMVNFVVLSENGARIGATVGAGVVFSGHLGGWDSVADTHYSNGVYIAGGDTFAHGSVYKWNDANGAVITLVYSAPFDTIEVTMVSGYRVRCGLSPVSLFARPLCGNIGITFDKVAGIVTFESTPVQYPPSSGGITATGSLSFAPF